MKDLSNKNILVTGASKGIGAAIVENLAKANANIVAHYFSDKIGINEVISSCCKENIVGFQADFKKEEDIDENVKNIQCFSFAKNSNVNFEIISRSKITEKKNGPLIILESTSVTYVDTNYTVHKDKLDNLIITDEEL